jgi:hypothetical protein
MQTIRSPNRRFKLVLHGTKSRKTSLIDSIPEDSSLAIVSLYGEAQ